MITSSSSKSAFKPFDEAYPRVNIQTPQMNEPQDKTSSYVQRKAQIFNKLLNGDFGLERKLQVLTFLEKTEDDIPSLKKGTPKERCESCLNFFYDDLAKIAKAAWKKDGEASASGAPAPESSDVDLLCYETLT